MSINSYKNCLLPSRHFLQQQFNRLSEAVNCVRILVSCGAVTISPVFICLFVLKQYMVKLASLILNSLRSWRWPSASDSPASPLEHKGYKCVPMTGLNGTLGWIEGVMFARQRLSQWYPGTSRSRWQFLIVLLVFLMPCFSDKSFQKYARCKYFLLTCLWPCWFFRPVFHKMSLLDFD